MTYYMNPHPALARSPRTSMGEGTGVRAGYRNCLYGHDIRASFDNSYAKETRGDH